MKKLILAALIIAAVSACASDALLIWPDGSHRPYGPKSIVLSDGREIIGPSLEACVEQGDYRMETPEEVAERHAAAAQAQAEAEAQRVAALAGSYGGAVAVLQANLSTVGWSIPCDAEAVTADLIDRAHAKTLTEAQREAKDDIFQAYFILQSKGVSNADIAAIWELIGGGE